MRDAQRITVTREVPLVTALDDEMVNAAEDKRYREDCVTDNHGGQHSLQCSVDFENPSVAHEENCDPTPYRNEAEGNCEAGEDRRIDNEVSEVTFVVRDTIQHAVR